MEAKTKSAGSELLSMMALVAGVVAIVILVFFGIGYLFGSLFLYAARFFHTWMWTKRAARVPRSNGEVDSPPPEVGPQPWH